MIGRRLFLKMAGAALACTMLRLRQFTPDLPFCSNGFAYVLEDADGGLHGPDKIVPTRGGYEARFNAPPPGRYRFVVLHDESGRVWESGRSVHTAAGDGITGRFTLDYA